MLQKTRGIVLRSVKYGDTSLISTLFTAQYGIQTYIIQGIRSSRSKNSRAGLLQPASLLDLVVYHKPNANLQHLREFQPAHIYLSLQEEVVKNSIALFSVELLLRLLPEHAPAPELFDFAFDYFCALDKMPVAGVANFPLFFIIQCSRYLGYELKGHYSTDTPYLNLQEGGFTSHAPVITPFISDEDTTILARLLKAAHFAELGEIEMNAQIRYRLLDWYLEFLHQHTQHLGSIKSLAVLQAVLH